jgi:stage II sporulation protein D
MTPMRRTAGAITLLACAAALAAGPGAPSADGATWVIHGKGLGHGIGMSQYGAYGFAKHGRGYKRILDHYYKNTRVGKTPDTDIRVLLDSGLGSVSFSKATHACGKHLNRRRAYSFSQSGSSVKLSRLGGNTLARCGRAGTATGKGVIRIGGRRYRGRLRVKNTGGLLVTNVAAVDAYAKGVVPNEMVSSWPQAALKVQAVTARSYALATGGNGPFDVYDDTRSQVYGGLESETTATNRAVARTSREVVRYGHQIATTYYFSTSGGETESIQFGFPGAAPVPYLKGVNDPYDRSSPLHRWTVRYSQRRMESRLSGLFAGHLRRIKVLQHGVSPRIVRARVVGSGGSSSISGLGLQSRLGLNSTWATFKKR